MAAKVGILFPTILPFFKSPPNKEIIEKWVTHNSQTPMMRAIARKFADNINYISFEAFLAQLKITIDDFHTKVQEPYVLWITQEFDTRKDKGCSELWVAGLAFEYCDLRQPEAIVWTDKLNDYMAEHPEIKHVLILDDASYSGMHLSQQIDGFYSIARRNSRHDNSGHEKTKSNGYINKELNCNRHLYIAIPFISLYAKNKIEECDWDRGICQNKYFLAHQIISTIRDFLSQDEINALDTVRSYPLHRTLTYFDHRFPDRQSTFEGLQDGRHLLNINEAMRLMGFTRIELEHGNPLVPSITYLTTPDEWNAKVTELYSLRKPLVPVVIPPYRFDNDFRNMLTKALKDHSHGDRTQYPIPEHYKLTISMLTQSGISVKTAKSDIDLTNVEMMPIAVDEPLVRLPTKTEMNKRYHSLIAPVVAKVTEANESNEAPAITPLVKQDPLARINTGSVPDEKVKQDYYALLAQLVAKQEEFQEKCRDAISSGDIDKANNYLEATGAVLTLYQNLKSTANKFFSGKIDVTTFNRQSQRFISAERPILQQNRDCNYILARIGLFIGTFIVGYLVAGAVNYALTGNFHFFSKTDSAKKVDAIEAQLHSISVQATKN